MATFTKSSLWSAWGSIILLSVSVFIAVQSVEPPALKIESEPTKFSVGKVLNHLEQIARYPHPVGTAKHDSVRNYIVRQLKSMGYTPELQKTLISTPFSAKTRKSDSTKHTKGYRTAYVENILVRIKGKRDSTAVMVAGHYDSAIGSRGAGDAGSVVASMLDMLRIFRLEKHRPQNDIIFLFSDAEEIGMMGAKAFVEKHSWAKDVQVVLNFDARGANGVSYLFETSENNGWLIEQFASQALYPRTSSMAYDVYKVMPNYTDFTVFRKAGIKGLNFAFIGKHTSYHTQLDNNEELDSRTVQHQANYMLQMLKHLAHVDFREVQLETQNRVFFNFLGEQVIHYQTQWTPYIAGAIVIVFIILLLIGSLRRSINVGMLLVYWVLTGVFAVCIGFMCHFMWKVIMFTHPMYHTMPHGDTYNSNLYLVAFSLFSVAILTLCYTFIHKRINHLSLFGGSLLWWLIGVCLTSYHIPKMKIPFLDFNVPSLELYSSSYVFAIPLIGALIVWGFLIMRGRSKKYTFLDAVIVGALSIGTIYILFPIIYMLKLALTIQWIGIHMGLVALVLILFIPLVKMLVDSFRWSLSFFLLLVSGLVLFYASFTAPFSEKRKKTNSILYVQDMDKKVAHWASYDKKLDVFTKQFIIGEPKLDSLKLFFPTPKKRTFLTKQLDTIHTTLSPPIIKFVSDSVDDKGTHYITAKLQSLRQSSQMYLIFENNTPVKEVWLDDELITNQQGVAFLEFYALPKEGVNLRIVSSKPLVKTRLVDIKYGLDEVWSKRFKPRASYMMPLPAKRTAINNAVLVHKSYVLGTKNEEVSDNN